MLGLSVDQKGFVPVIILIVVVVIGVLGYVFVSNSNNEGRENIVYEKGKSNLAASNQNQTDSSNAPNDLSIPFDLKDVNEEQGGVNPMGVVRGSKDMEGKGHGGIDFPLFEGSDIFAVADGEIVDVIISNDPWGGQDVIQLLSKTGNGEGWGFLYEHVTPTVSKGDMVRRGQVIGTKTAPDAFTAHLQMTKLFNNYEYYKDDQCWPELLRASERVKFESWWDAYKKLDSFIDGWMTVQEKNGEYQFRGLLDGGKSPEYCYPPGTDVR